MSVLVRPPEVGTFWLGETRAWYTIGGDHVWPALLELIRLAEIRCCAVACDIETAGTGALAMTVKCVTFALEDRAVILDPRDPRQVQMIRDTFRRLAGHGLAFHFSPFDVPILVRSGLMPLASVQDVVDTLVWSRLAEPDERASKGLQAASARWLGATPADHLYAAMRALGLSRAEGYKQFDIDRPLYVFGAAIDAVMTARLVPVVRAAAVDRLATHPFGGPKGWGLSRGPELERLVDREQVINRVFLRRSCRGIRVDLEYLDAYREREGRQQAQDRAVVEAEGIRPGVAADLTAWLDARGLVPAGYPRTPKTGQPSGEAKHLEALASQVDVPLVTAFVRLKRSEKIDKDYLSKVVDLADSDDRVHPTVSILGATTGRSAYSDPPTHQFPEGARGILLADPGDSMTSIDWSQIEPVIGANVARDLPVLEQYDAGTGDLYTSLAELAAISRKQAKVVLLAQMYGEGMAKLAADLGISVDDAASLREAIFRPMPKVAAMLGRLRQIARTHQMVFTVSGRIIPIPMGMWDGRPSVAAHKGPNYFIQGSAYDEYAETVVAIEEAGLGDALYLGMHDEFVVSTDAAHDIRKIMETPSDRLCAMAGRVPVLRTDRADLGERWAAA